MDFNDYYEYWQARVQRDLFPFIDPASRLDVQAVRRKIIARWTAGGVAHEAIVNVALDGVSVELTRDGHSRNGPLPYRSFLASPPMADLNLLAQNIVRMKRKAIYVESIAQDERSDSSRERPATDLIQEMIRDGEYVGQTGIVFLVGDAGTGKTQILRRLVETQAERYLRGQEDTLLLYIDAQGRAQARFNEALATELQDLRARITYHAVATLSRAGVLVPVIDGFDELLGAAGYEDAFKSLAGFLEELDGHGHLIAAARSSYYELEFVTRANTESALGSQSWRLLPVRVKTWGDQERTSYVDQACQAHELTDSDRERLKQRVSTLFAGRNGALSEKPFFVAKAVEMALADVDLTSGDDAVEQFVAHYMEREKHKVVDQNGMPLLDEAQLREMLTVIAEEMWNEESRSLTPRTVREITEIALAELDRTDIVREMVIAKIPTIAPLTADASQRVSFEHEIFFSYFLSVVMRRALGGNEAVLRMLLGRSPLPIEIADHVAESVVAGGEYAWRDTLEVLERCCRSEDRRGRAVRENSGILTAYLLRHAARDRQQLGEVRLAGSVFAGVSLEGVTIERGVLENVRFERADLTRTRFIGCTGREVAFHDILVDPTQTRIEVSGVNLADSTLNLRRRTERGVEAVYDPAEVRNVLEQIGAVPVVQTPVREWTVPRRVRLLVERLVRAYGRANPISPDDMTMRQIFEAQEWIRVERLLVRHELVQEETRSTSGSRKRFFRRRFLPQELLAGIQRDARVPDSVKGFWRDIQEEFQDGVPG